MKGRLTDREKVLVDVGTGFYVEKVGSSSLCGCGCGCDWAGSVMWVVGADEMQTTENATKFYDQKVKNLDANLLDLEKIVQGKSSSLNAVEEGRSFFFLFQ